MKTKLFKNIFLLIFIASSSISFAQKIECDTITFFKTLKEPPSTDYLGLKVEGVLDISELTNDTVVLKTQVEYGMFIGPKNFKAYLHNKDSEPTVLQTSVIEDNGIQLLKIILPNKSNAKVQFSYYILGGSLITWQDNDSFESYQGGYGRYFYPMNISIRNAIFLTDEDLIGEISYKKGTDEIKNINLYFLIKNDYKTHTIKEGNCEVKVFVPDTLVNNTKMMQSINELQENIQKLSKYTPISCRATLFFINWRNDELRAACGQAFNQEYIVCDIFFQGKDLFHELLHVLLTSEIEKGYKGRFFIEESIIEWLALYFANEKPELIFKDTQTNTTVYDASINDKRTMYVIYYTSPLNIQKIAAKCGEEKMAQCIISFLIENKNKTTNYDAFIQHLSNCLSKELAEELDHLVKTSITPEE